MELRDNGSKFKENVVFKKGQVGLTLTWFTAFIVIFFIMLLFVAMSSILTLKKVLPFYGEGFNEVQISSGKDLGSLDNQKKLIYLLNSPVDEDKELKNLILENRQDIKNKSRIILNEMVNEEECYYFKIGYDSGDEVLVSNKKNIGYVDVWNLQRTSKLNIFHDNKEINAALYIGECL